VQVYNSHHALIYDSNLRYFLNTVKITNLQDNGHYYIIATGETVSGMPLSTDMIDFSADFLKSQAYFMCELQNMYDAGGVYIKSNIISVEGYSDSGLLCIDDDVADLTNNVVHFNKGFALTGDFTLLVKGYGFEDDSRILQLSGKDEFVTVEYKSIAGIYYFELVATYKMQRYFIMTVNPYHNKPISLYIRRKDGLFGIEVVG